jgi:hypothetical protein
MILSEALRYYPDRSVTLRPEPGEKMTLSESNLCHLALLHYSGGWPVPRAESSSSGGLQINAN